jgi:hypothetical protein
MPLMISRKAYDAAMPLSAFDLATYQKIKKNWFLGGVCFEAKTDFEYNFLRKIFNVA